MWLRTEALYHFYVMQSEAGLRAVAQGLRLAEEAGVHLLDLMFYGVGIYHATVRNDTAMAEEYLERMTSVLTHGSSTYAAIYHASQASLVSLLKGDIPRAVGLVERSLRLTKEAGAPLIENSLTAQMAFIMIEGKPCDGMEDQIAALRKIGSEVRSANSDAWCAILLSQVALQNGDDELFAERFAHATSVCGRTGLRLLAFLPATVSGVCCKALELGIETEFAKELIRLYRLEPGSAKIVTDAWPWPLKIYTLGRFELVRADKPVVFSGKVQKKPLELLKILLAMGGEERSEGELADLLWPEGEGDAAKSSLKVTLHRLRELLGTDKVMQVKEGRLFLDRCLVWVDAWAFEYLLTAAQYKAEEGDTTAAVRLTEKALAVYRGLEVDDLAEELYQNLMTCYHAAGLGAEAIATFKRCRLTLAAHGAKPSARTQSLYQSIIAS